MILISQLFLRKIVQIKVLIHSSSQPGSPGTPGQAVTGCNPDQRFCCNNLSGRPATGVTVAPNLNAPLTHFGQCGVRHNQQLTAVSPIVS